MCHAETQFVEHPLDAIASEFRSDHSEIHGNGFCKLITDTSRVLDMLGGLEAFREFHSHDCKQRFADDRPYGSTLTEPDMIDMARDALNGFEPSNLKTLPKRDRDQGLRLLKLSMLTQAQIALVTGISASTVSRA